MKTSPTLSAQKKATPKQPRENVETAVLESPRSASRQSNVALIVGLSLFSCFVTCFFFLLDKTLYWDTAQHFVQFRDNLNSFNQFGEPAWWFPHVQLGWPSYYYSILGFPHGASPLFAGIAFLCWLLGRLGIIIQNYHLVYVLYFGFLTPLTFLFSVNLFARQFLKTRAALGLALILAAFSPGVMANISDIGFLEPAAYSLFFGAALIAFFRRQSKSSFYVLGFTVLVLGLSCNYSFLFWNLVIIPIFVVGFIFLGGRRPGDLWQKAKEIKLWQWALLVALFVAGLLPNLCAYLATQELVKPALGSQSYTFLELKPGNPLSALVASLPGFGFDWFPGYRENWTLRPRTEQGVHLAYNYMGLLCLPLVLFGMIFGRTLVRTQMILVLIAVFAVINLSGYSPFFSWLLALPTPLRSVNHYSDLLYRAGGFIVLLLAAAFGLDTALERKHIHKPMLLKIYGVVTVIGLASFAYGFKEKTSQSATFGFTLFLAVIIAISLLRVTITHWKKELRIAVRILLLLTLIDVSTHSLIHVRRVMLPNTSDYKKVEETPAEGGIGLKSSTDPYYFVNSVLVYRSLMAMMNTGVDLMSIDQFKLFTSAHLNESIDMEMGRISSGGFKQYRSLVLSEEDKDVPEFRPFLTQPDGVSAVGNLKVQSMSYNHFHLQANSSAPALLFIRDSYSRFWNAEVNGKTVPVARALYNFKAIPIPAGTSKILLEYRPTRVVIGLTIAYAGFVALGIYCLVLRKQERRNP